MLGVKTNCLTEIMFESALSSASAIDDEFAKTGRSVGPLHGLPVSLKGQLQGRGYGQYDWIGSLGQQAGKGRGGEHRGADTTVMRGGLIL